jgi:hypothetical protein
VDVGAFAGVGVSKTAAGANVPVASEAAQNFAAHAFETRAAGLFETVIMGVGAAISFRLKLRRCE